MKYTQIPANTFKEMQLNAGILVDAFTPSTAVIGSILGATTGGLTFSTNPTFEDFGADVDNAPRNTKELKKQTGEDITLSGTFVTMTTTLAKRTMGAADIDSLDSTHIIPRNDLEDSDFDDIWWIGDYSDKNGATNGGYVAIHMKNALSTGGFQIKSNDRGKGNFAFTYTAHRSIATQDEVPYEVYIKAGTAEPTQ